MGQQLLQSGRALLSTGMEKVSLIALHGILFFFWLVISRAGGDQIMMGWISWQKDLALLHTPNHPLLTPRDTIGANAPGTCLSFHQVVLFVTISSFRSVPNRREILVTVWKPFIIQPASKHCFTASADRIIGTISFSLPASSCHDWRKQNFSYVKSVRSRTVGYPTYVDLLLRFAEGLLLNRPVCPLSPPEMNHCWWLQQILSFCLLASGTVSYSKVSWAQGTWSETSVCFA